MICRQCRVHLVHPSATTQIETYWPLGTVYVGAGMNLPLALGRHAVAGHSSLTTPRTPAGQACREQG